MEEAINPLSSEDLKLMRSASRFYFTTKGECSVTFDAGTVHGVDLGEHTKALAIRPGNVTNYTDTPCTSVGFSVYAFDEGKMATVLKALKPGDELVASAVVGNNNDHLKSVRLDLCEGSLTIYRGNMRIGSYMMVANVLPAGQRFDGYIHI